MSVITGKNGGETLNGGSGNDTITGGTGNDRILTGDGDDSIDGGDGNDQINGYPDTGLSYMYWTYTGIKTISGGNGDDFIYGASGNDLLFGDAGNDSIYGSLGDDSLDGGSGNDYLSGGDGADTLVGGDGNDSFFGGFGNDLILGGYGDDVLNKVDETGNDTVYGGEGNDLINFTKIAGNKLIFGENGNDSLYGGISNDTINGGAGDDSINGGAGDDSLIGGDGNDYIQGNDGTDSIYGGSGNDTLTKYSALGSSYLDGGIGDDTIWGGNGNDTIIGGEGNDSWLEGYEGNDSISGGSGNDKLDGDEGNDSLDGGTGNDSLSGGNGADILVGGDGNDRLLTGEGNDTAYGGDGNDQINGYLTGEPNHAHKSWSATGDLKLYGEAGNDFIFGGTGSDVISGGTGDDEIFAKEGNDTVYGESGNDYISAGEGNDLVYSGDGNDRILTGDGSDYIEGGNGDDEINSYIDSDGLRIRWTFSGNVNAHGNDGNDVITGSSGNDELYGDNGNDKLYGDDGNDILDGGSGVNELKGGLGNDTYYVHNQQDFIQDTGGIDIAYVSASFVKIPSTIEKVIYKEGAQALPYWIDALLPDEAAGLYYKTLLQNSSVFNYSFPKSLPNYDKSSKHADGFLAFTAEQISRTKEALSYISSLINLQFKETSDASQLNTLSFANNNQTGTAGYAQMPDDSLVGSDVFLNKTSQTTFTLKDGQYQTHALIHEVGHALGLDHPFNTPSAGSGVSADPSYLTGVEDSTTWTVMSYTDSPAQYYLQYSPLDIATLHYLYGPSTTSRTGNDIYKITQSASNFIWDGGGSDTIDISGISQGSTVYLTPGYWGFIGNTKATNITTSGQITVNFGSVIENLIGSNYDDLLYGNEIGNKFEGGAGSDSIEGWDGEDTLLGGAGNDYLTGGSGNDSIEGGDGLDTLVLNGIATNYAILFDSTTQSYSISAKSGTEGKDTFKTIELLKFSDKTVTLQSLDLSPPTYSVSSQKPNVDEGEIATFNIATTKVNTGTILKYTITGVSSADISGGLLSGNVTIGSDGTGRISVGLLADYLTEGPETIKVTLEGKSASTLINDKFVNKGPAASDLVYVFKSEKVGVGINPASFSYFYTTNTQEASSIKAQTNWPWVEKTATFEAAHSIINLAVPVFRFWSEKFQAHFFTINKDEKDQIISWSQTGKNGYEWKYEGENFKVYTSTTPTDDLGKPAIPVYRIWMDDKDFNPANGLSGGHYFTANKTEYDAMIKLTGVVGEGVAFYGEVPGN